mmetsp:Transcript_10813/g.43781  ORF Transcript_10813/g.43781 Transcript_10813/m.43781 type:complete len:284 (+) Transcript_10813:176-1027(+)
MYSREAPRTRLLPARCGQTYSPRSRATGGADGPRASSSSSHSITTDWPRVSDRGGSPTTRGPLLGASSSEPPYGESNSRRYAGKASAPPQRTTRSAWPPRRASSSVGSSTRRATHSAPRAWHAAHSADRYAAISTTTPVASRTPPCSAHALLLSSSHPGAISKYGAPSSARISRASSHSRCPVSRSARHAACAEAASSASRLGRSTTSVATRPPPSEELLAAGACAAAASSNARVIDSASSASQASRRRGVSGWTSPPATAEAVAWYDVVRRPFDGSSSGAGS